MKACPGKCGNEVEDGILCCDRCWLRIPTNLPDQPRWRTRRRMARATRSWLRFELATDAALTWLQDHPRSVDHV